MNIRTFHEYPPRPAGFIDRGAEMASRAAGLGTFALCVIGLLYLIVF
ncbi:hypothetical protein LWE61_19975 [Sphingobium sufflavum]|nr:hypothetical protein [Sphingobium sufflavum]MCE7798810.1 hypothetical protein [Sphingobium sufflavum]